MDHLFIKNLSIMSQTEQSLLSKKKVLIAGCGGLGSAVFELMLRTGFQNLTVADPDCFAESNMNRQILCTTSTLGRQKVHAAYERAGIINPEADITIINERLDENNIYSSVHGKDIVIDALDNIESRLLLEKACEAASVPLVHGGIDGWQLQIGICMPGSRILEKIYSNIPPASGNHDSGGIAATVFACSSFEVSEAVKYLLGRENTLVNKILFFDLIEKQSQILDFENLCSNHL